jgi:hypothetical protein
MRKITATTAMICRDQFARCMRFLNRLENQSRNVVDYQDDTWAFFQNCWHLKDWIYCDKLIAESDRMAMVSIAEKHPALLISADLCNRTKHLELDKNQKPRSGAEHLYLHTIIVDGVTTVDCEIRLGDGARRSTLGVARECMKAWDEILTKYSIAH